ncbi:MAG: transglycosylase domain-containing protein, partial [Acidimicrobiia bacterium]
MDLHQAERHDRRGRRLLAITVIGAVGVLAAAWVGLFAFIGINAAVGTIEDVGDRYIPEVDDLALDLPRVSQLSEVFTGDGVRLGFLTERNSQPIALEDIPDTVISAVLAAEDSGFYEHEGVDFKGIARAAVLNFRNDSVVGGSSITQQVVKQNFGSTDLTLERKIAEAVVAAELERRYTKDEILEFYVNSVFFGSNAYGVKAAAQEYFAKDLGELTVAEAASMVTSIRNPTLYNPRRFPEGVLRARNAVIANMEDEGFISHAEAAAAIEEPLVIAEPQPSQEIAPQVMIAARDELLNDPRFDVLGKTFEERKRAIFGCPAADTACELSGGTKGGLTITVTVDLGLQESANGVLADWFPHTVDGSAPTGAIAMVDNRTGAVKVMATGVPFGNDLAAGERPYDIAGRGQRNPGSAFKPIGLLAALEYGERFGSPITMGTYWDSTSPQILDYEGAPKPWECSNAGGGGSGLRSLFEATVNSVNAVYCQVAIATGAENIVEIAHRIGIESELAVVPSLILGAGAVSPLEMAQAFSTIANYGERVEPYLISEIVNSDGEILYEHEVKRDQVVEPALAASVVRALKEAVARGTGTNAKIGRPQGGKTGTHQNYTDAWFMGFIPQYTTAVWVGYPDQQIPLRNVFINGQSYSRVFGGSVPAPVWNDFMTIVTADLPVEEFPPEPEGMEPYFKTPTSEVPEFTPGDSETDITKAILQAGLQAVVSEVPSDEPEGTVLVLIPPSGSRLTQGGTVTIEVSSGAPATRPLPPLIGLTVDQALASIALFEFDAGFSISVATSNRVVTDPTLYGRVVGTAPGPGAPVGA